MAGAKGDVFWFGGQYVPVAKAPEVGLEHWDQDIRQLRELGFTAFRGFVSWDRLEPEEGRRDWTFLDRALDLAAQHEVKVLLSLGGVFGNLAGVYPPQWLIRDYGCQQPVPDASRRREARPSGPRQSVCIDDPVYREKARAFAVAVVERYSTHPALAGWVSWNEPANTPCFCEHTQARFRAWLQQRYDSLAQLVAAWSLEFPVLYRQWSEVEAPSGVGFLHGGYQPWLDWHTFLQANLTEALLGYADLVRQHDRVGHANTVNFTPGELTNAAVAKGLNIWDIGRGLERPGMSAYSLWDPPQVDPVEAASRYARMRSVSTAPGRPWYVVETEAGPVYWVHGMVPRFTRTPDRLLRYWQIVAHGAKAIFCWMYRSRVGNAQAGEFNLLAWDGSPTERARATGDMSRVINQHADVFMNRFPRAEVAILAAHSTDLLYRCETQEASPANFRNYWHRSWLGAYRKLWARRIPAEFIDDTHLTAGDLAAYKAILVPFHVNLAPDVAEALARYVEQGGTVVADFPLGMKDNGGNLLMQSPGPILREVFGAWANDACPVDAGEDEVTLGDQTLTPLDFRQELYPLDGAEVLGRWRDGGAAVVARQHGQGRAVLAGTLLFANDSGAAADLVARELATAGVRPEALVAALGATTKEALARVEVSVQWSLDGARRLVTVLNHGAEPVQLTVTLPDCAADAADVVDLLTGQTLPANATDGSLALTVELAGKAVCAVDLPGR